MQKKQLKVVNKLGLHAREPELRLERRGDLGELGGGAREARRVNAKSIMGVMMLAAGLGSTLELEADGADEAEAIDAIEKLFADKFGEGE